MLNLLRKPTYEFLRQLLYFQIRKGHLHTEQRIRIEPLPEIGNLVYNPAIHHTENKRFCVFRRRRRDGARNLCRAEMDTGFNLIPESVMELDEQLAHGSFRGPFEDARIFQRNGTDYLIYYCNRSLHIVPISIEEGKALASPRLLVSTENGIEQRLDVEKNWTFFEADGDIFVIYSVFPFRILRPLNWEGWEGPLNCEFHLEHSFKDTLIRRSRNPFGWERREYWNSFQWGSLRGGTPPVAVGDSFFIFPHSYSYTKVLGSYSILGFSRKPPFEITHLPTRPIGFPDIEHLRYSEYFPRLTLMFPCSAHFTPETGKWLISSGRDDYCMEFLTHDHQQVLETCNRPSNKEFISRGPGI